MENFLTNITSSTDPLLLPFSSTPMNCSSWNQHWQAPYLHRLAHLDVQLYQDFYTLWISLMVMQRHYGLDLR